MKRILSIDGGGIKGALPAAFLATLEQQTQASIVDQFDLIAGTSTGGIIAVGLGLGFTASEILEFYKREGPAIFAPSGLFGRLRRWFEWKHDEGAVYASLDHVFGLLRHLIRAKYDAGPLRAALERILGERRLGESGTRLLIPAFDSVRGQVRVFKTSHHPRLELDYKDKAVDVAMATAAAPTYFPAHQIEAGSFLVDGGIWANNPVGFAVIEGIARLGWEREEIRVLSLGCSSASMRVSKGGGLWSLGRRAVDLMMQGQAMGALGAAKLLLGHTDTEPRLWQVNPHVAPGTFSLDDAKNIAELAGVGQSAARDFLPTYRKVFLIGSKEAFFPCHNLNADPLSQAA